MDLKVLEHVLFVWMLTNLGLYLFTVICALGCRNLVARLNSALFKIDEQTVRQGIFRYIAHYKVLFICFNFTPWLALYLMRVFSL